MALARPLRWMGDGVNLPLTLGALAFAVYASRAGPYELRLLSVAGAYAILVIGYQFIFSYAGAASLAQSCFFGLGAYVTGVLGATYGFGSETTLPLSISCSRPAGRGRGRRRSAARRPLFFARDPGDHIAGDAGCHPMAERHGRHQRSFGHSLV